MTDFDGALITRRCGELVREHYLFAEVGEQLGKLLDRGTADGRYSTARGAAALADVSTIDLQSLNHDLHLRLLHHADPLPDLRDEAMEMAMYTAMARGAMNGIRRVERLDGNVGLLALGPKLFPVDIAGAAVCAAMNLVADVSGLIIDLRDMKGGDPAMVALICSYLVGEPLHLNSMVTRDGTSTQSWTLPWVPGARFGASKPVWVLTSHATFSGGEELAYDLQQLNRATIVGEVTGGGAHAREGYVVHPHLELTVPVAAGRNPTSGTNWEGVGVVPDVPIDAAKALVTAHQMALSLG
jgi:Peptidase family S41/N-terminal domain of Peptidase_S41 in eukaryotic IRBP